MTQTTFWKLVHLDTHTHDRTGYWRENIILHHLKLEILISSYNECFPFLGINEHQQVFFKAVHIDLLTIPFSFPFFTLVFSPFLPSLHLCWVVGRKRIMSLKFKVLLLTGNGLGTYCHLLQMPYVILAHLYVYKYR